MKGTIVAINKRNLFHAVHKEDDEFMIFELTDSHEPQVGDVVIGDLDALGGEMLRNLSQQEEFDVFIQHIHCSKLQAMELVSR